MNAQTKIKAATKAVSDIQYFALDDLYLSDLNPRQDVPEEDVQLMADSLLAAGLIHPLNGLLDDKGKAGIVAGGRRLRGLAIAAKTNPALAMVPVTVTKDRDVAVKWASTENMARQALSVVDAINAYGLMAKTGKRVNEIASCFGVTEKHVYKLLKLVDLPKPVLDALRAKSISIDVAQTMTVCSDKEKVLEGLKLAIENRWNVYSAKNFFCADTIRGTDRRAKYIGADAFKEAGGDIVEDLFNEEQQWSSVELLDELFEAKLQIDAEELRKARGWNWMEVTTSSHFNRWDVQETLGYRLMDKEGGELDEIQTDRYEELSELANEECIDEAGQLDLEALQSILDGEFTEAQKTLGGIIVYVGRDGKTEFVEGAVKPEDDQAAQDAEFLSKIEPIEKTEKSDYSIAFVEDMDAIAKGSLQAKLLNNPELVLDLVAFSLSDLVMYDTPIGIRLETPRNTPSKDDGFILPQALDDSMKPQFDYRNKTSLADRFKAFRERGQKARNELLVQNFSRALGISKTNDLFAALQEETKSHMRQVWTPSETNCFKRLRGDLLDDCYCEVMELKRGTTQFKEFSKLKKAEKAKALHKLFNDAKHQKALKLTDKQISNIQNWVPSC